MALPYRHTVTIQREAKTSDGMGGIVKAMVDVVSAFADIQPVSAERRLEYSKMGVNITHQVFLKGHPSVSSGDYVKWGNRVLKVQAVIDPLEIGHHVELVALEEVK